MKKIIIFIIMVFALSIISYGCSKTSNQNSENPEIKEVKEIEVDHTIPSEPLVKKLVSEVVENPKNFAKIAEFSSIEVGREAILKTTCVTMFGVYQCFESKKYYFNCKFKVNCFEKSTNKVLASVGYEIQEGELVADKVGKLKLGGFYDYENLCVDYNQDNSIIETDKPVYNYGEKITVHYYNAPGHSGDWICIVSAGASHRSGGDWKNIPTSGQGDLTFESPKPGKYEARAYYQYDGYKYDITASYRFTVK